MGFFPFLLGASLAASPLQAPAPAQAPARPLYPALWVVNDGDTIIYLFGTFHALDGRSQWFGQAVKTAFSQSDELMLETVVPRPGADSASKSRGKAGRNGKAEVSQKGHRPSPIAQLAPSASFLATTKLVMSAGRAKGMSIDRGADAVLRDAADEAGKPVAGLESYGFQLNMFGSLPAGPQRPAAAQDPRVVQALGAILAQLQAAWSRGEVEQTFTPLLRQMRAQSPQAYNRMFVERNARWAQWIADRLETPGTVFVAVGAGHLTGPDSVQNQLESLGVRSARVN